MNDTFLTKLINTYERNLIPYYRGVYNMEEFLNQSATKINRNGDNIFVFNTETEKDYGHWIAFLTVSTDRGGKAFFVDSFARPPEVYDSELKDTLETLAPHGTFEVLPYPVQNEKSKACGLWVLYFLIKFGKNPASFSFVTALKAEEFNRRGGQANEDDYNSNELKLYRYFVSRYNVPISKLLPSASSLGRLVSSSSEKLHEKVSR